MNGIVLSSFTVTLGVLITLVMTYGFSCTAFSKRFSLALSKIYF